MNKLYTLLFVGFALCALAALSLLLPIEGEPLDEPVGPPRLIEWTDLIPKEDLDALLNPPDYITNIPEGSVEEELSAQVASAIGAAKNDRYQQALVSSTVIPEFDKQRIKIPGFIVPLSFGSDEDDMTITEFFLVPFFGACIHVPPPPPNQMIHVSYPKGLVIEALYDPFFVEGTLLVKSFDSGQMGQSAYSMSKAKVSPYTE